MENRRTGTRAVERRQRVRVMIVEDHPVIRGALTILVGKECELEVCGEAEDVAAAVEQIRNTSPAVIILGMGTKGTQALEEVRRIKQQFSSIHVIVASMREDTTYAERALRAGASGFLRREEMMEQVIAAIRLVVSGGVFLSSQMTHCLLQHTVLGRVEETDPVEKLSRRQLEIFELIGQGHSVRQIAGRLGLSPKTVEGHREMVKTKLGLKNGNELSRLAYRWMLEGS